jgi:hypothetical protein
MHPACAAAYRKSSYLSGTSPIFPHSKLRVSWEDFPMVLPVGR